MAVSLDIICVVDIDSNRGRLRSTLRLKREAGLPPNKLASVYGSFLSPNLLNN